MGFCDLECVVCSSKIESFASLKGECIHCAAPLSGIPPIDRLAALCEAAVSAGPDGWDFEDTLKHAMVHFRANSEQNKEHWRQQVRDVLGTKISLDSAKSQS